MKRADLVVGEEYVASTIRGREWSYEGLRTRARRVRVVDLGPFIAVTPDSRARITIGEREFYAVGFDRPDSGRHIYSARIYAVACEVLDQATGAVRARTLVDCREFRDRWTMYEALHADALAGDRARIEERAAADEAERAERLRHEEAARRTAGLAARVGLRSGTTVAHHVYERPGQPWPEVDRRVLDALLAHAAETGWTWQS